MIFHHPALPSLLTPAIEELMGARPTCLFGIPTAVLTNKGS